MRWQRLLFSIVAICFVIPLAVLAYLSLSANWYFPALWSHSFTLEHWHWLLRDGSPLTFSLLLSVGLSLSVSVAATALGFFVSRLLAYHTTSTYWLLGAYFPYVIAPVVFAVMLNVYLLRLGLTGTLGGVMLAQLLITFPYAILFFYGFWNERIRNLEHLVRTLGGNFRTVVTQAILPSARGLIAVCFFQTYLISWFEYGLTQFIGVGKVPTLTIMVFRYISEANPHLAALAGLLLILPPLGLLVVNRRFLLHKAWSI